MPEKKDQKSEQKIRAKIQKPNEKLIELVEKLIMDDEFYAQFKETPEKYLGKYKLKFESEDSKKDFIGYLLGLRDQAILDSLKTGMPIVRMFAPKVSFLIDAGTKRDTSAKVEPDTTVDVHVSEELDITIMPREHLAMDMDQHTKILKDTDVKQMIFMDTDADQDISMDTDADQDISMDTDADQDISMDTDAEAKARVKADADMDSMSEIRVSHDLEATKDAQALVDTEVDTKIMEKVLASQMAEAKQEAVLRSEIEVKASSEIKERVEIQRDASAKTDPDVGIIGKASVSSETMEYTHNNWDLSEHTNALYESMESTKAGYATAAEKKTHAGVSKSFPVEGVAFRKELIEKFNKWALVRPEVLEELMNKTSKILEDLENKYR